MTLLINTLKSLFWLKSSIKVMLKVNYLTLVIFWIILIKKLSIFSFKKYVEFRLKNGNNMASYVIKNHLIDL